MKKYLTIIALAVIFGGCSDDWFNLNPSTSLTPETAFQTISDADVALNGAYKQLYSSTSGYTYYGADLVTLGDAKGDDIRCYQAGKRTQTQYEYRETAENGVVGLWARPYNVLMNVNAILEKVDGLPTESSADEAARDNIKGQALALRAEAHFDLVRLFAPMPANSDPATTLGVPVVTRVISPSDKLSRNTVAEVYAQIITDLQNAIPLLSTDHNTEGRINQWAAKALLARVYLYYGNNTDALSLSEDVIANGGYSLLSTTNYVSSWSMNYSSEDIWNVVTTTTSNCDRESVGYLYDPNGYGAITASNSFITFMQSDPSDIRNSILGVDSRDSRTAYVMKYPGKEGASTIVNNTRVVRLSEVYLMAAEAAIKSSNQTKADLYFNAIYKIRRGIAASDPDVTATLDNILDERRRELVGEGYRFFDLMRNGRTVTRSGADQFTTELTLTPSDHRAILPIPRQELDANSNMVQNPQY